jgi:hypothetical protein
MLIQSRRGTADQWTSANPILAVAEMGFETDTRKFKYGDGLTAWVNLAYGISAANLSNATSVGIAVLTASTAAAARTALGVGTGTSVQSTDVLDSTSTGRSLLTAATAAAAQTALGATTIGKAILTAADAAGVRTAISAGTYSKPGTGIPLADFATSIQTSLGKADSALQVVASNLISDASTIGKSILTAADAAAVRSAIGAGTSNVTIGTTTGTALAGTYAPSSTSITDSTSVGRGLLTAATADAARAVIGAGTSSLALGTTASTALAGNYVPSSDAISDATPIGKALLTATNAESARSIIGAGSGTGTATINAVTIADSTAVGRSLLTAASAAAALAVIGGGTGTYSKPGTGIPSSDLTSAIQTSLGLANTALQTVSSASLSDATTVGKAVLVATDAAAARTAIGSGTYSKPSAGIPSTDLATAVQTSLGKADTAIQTVSSTTLSDATTVGRSLITATSAAAALTAIGAGNYTRPTNGIPLTDLSSTVQAILGLANTALQTVSSTTISDATAVGRNLLTASSTAAALTAIGAGSYSKPTTGIPSADLSTAVQTSLGLANTALQTVPAGFVQGSINGTSTTLTLWTGTAAQYAAIGTKSSTTVYIVT